MADLTEEQKLQAEERRQQEVAIYKSNRLKTVDLLESYKDEIAKALPSFLTPDRLLRVALTAMSKTPALMQCTQHSIISAVMTCAQLGLMPDGILGEAYLIPFKNTKKNTMECQIIIGYRGLCTLAMRSGQVKSINAHAVYGGVSDLEEAKKTGGDFFDFDMGLNEKLDHKPLAPKKDPAKITHFYAIVRFMNGGHSFVVMTRAQVDAIRDEAPNYKWATDRTKTIWHNYYEAMGIKTACRQLMKFVPMSSEVNKAVGLDLLSEAGKPQNNGLEFYDDLKNDNFTADITHEVIDQEEEELNKMLAEEKDGKAATGEAANSNAIAAINKKKAARKI